MNKTAEETLNEFAIKSGAANICDMVVLPGSGVTIKATAEALFKRIGPTKTMFMRGGAVVGIGENNGTSAIQVVGPAAARSRFESYADFWVWRAGHNTEPV